MSKGERNAPARRQNHVREVPAELDSKDSPYYTWPVKTVISVPDDVFRLADAEAMRAGLSRSEFYVQALRAYLDRFDESSITEQLDTVFAEVDQSPDPFLQRAAFVTLSKPEIGD